MGHTQTINNDAIPVPNALKWHDLCILAAQQPWAQEAEEMFQTQLAVELNHQMPWCHEYTSVTPTRIVKIFRLGSLADLHIPLFKRSTIHMSICLPMYLIDIFIYPIHLWICLSISLSLSLSLSIYIYIYIANAISD